MEREPLPSWATPQLYLNTYRGILKALLSGHAAAAYLKPGVDGSVRFQMVDVLEDAERMARNMILRAGAQFPPVQP